MTFSNKYRRVPCEEVKVDRENRHRRKLDVADLLPSIQARGVMNPIIIDKEFNLIAGERRLTASRQLKLPDIPARFIEDISPVERQIIELEENLKRSDLTWDEQAKAITRIHSLYFEIDPSWNQDKTAQALGLTKGWISTYLNVGKAISEGNKKIEKATTVRQAYNVLSREASRKEADFLADLTEGIMPEREPSELPPESIICGDFLEWAEGYSGPKFNFLHCDFPFGVNMQDSDQGRTDTWGGYEDTPEVYWTLLSGLSQFQDNFLSSTCHLMFWFSMTFYRETLDFFSQQMPEWDIDPFPLVWLKSDNRGILPDPKRGPRRIYETAFFGARGDRLIARAVSNAYAAPSGTKSHQSEKPEPMLKHFFQMFVDEQSKVIDPTCGSGSSLRAAESLHAQVVFGLEKNPEFAESAQSELRKFRSLRSLSR